MLKKLNFQSWFSCVRLMRIVIALTLASACHEPNKASKKSRQLSVEDTAYLKTIKWIRLNEFVAYHIIKQGKIIQDTGLRFSLNPLAGYYTSTGHFYTLKNNSTKDENAKNNINDTSTNPLIKNLTSQDKPKSLKKDSLTLLGPGQIRKLILSDTFSNKTSFDCLIKIDSKIYYKLMPWILKTITITPKAHSADSIRLLIKKLQKESFSETVRFTIRKRTEIDSFFEKNSKAKPNLSVIKITIKPKYQNLKDLPELCKQLKQWPDITDAVYVSMFTDRSETETIFRMTSK